MASSKKKKDLAVAEKKNNFPAGKSNIFLIGYRGTGKGAIGKEFARIAGMGFVDSDDEIEHREGKTIMEIFRELGEPEFRKMERKVIAGLCSKKSRRGIAIATGGGAVLDRDNVLNMKKCGVVVLLEASAEKIHERLERDAKRKGQQRPALTKLAPTDEIRHLLEARKPYYEGAADFRIDTEHTTVEEDAQKIAKLLGLGKPGKSRVIK